MKKLIFAAMLALPTLTFAHEYKAGDLMIDHPVSFETAATARAGAGYMTITNNGDADDVLLRAEADFPRVELHETVTEDGVATMQKQENVVLPAGESVRFEPGGKHVMFMGLSDPFEAGQEINVKLVFENAGEVDVIFNVEARDGEKVDHSGH
ncbi:copper chaperone PCu(A)C [Yoonia sp. 2307UL14-13]|uniref:copper chaperone PCu(A)C n=1 Tax=Yoonia sp. 2307UL14-13 TaxID=3126506 RepID=UPI0030A1A88B